VGAGVQLLPLPLRPPCAPDPAATVVAVAVVAVAAAPNSAAAPDPAAASDSTPLLPLILLSLLLSPLPFLVPPHSCPLGPYLVTLVWLSPVLVWHVVVLLLSLLQPPLVLHVRPPSA
jgi:hypothetical protein